MEPILRENNENVILSPESKEHRSGYKLGKASFVNNTRKPVNQNIEDIDEVQSAQLEALTSGLDRQKSSFVQMNSNNNKAANEMHDVVTEDIDLDNNLLLDEEDKGNGVDDLDDDLLI